MSSRTRRTTVKGGPLWGVVVARVIAAVNGKTLDSEAARDITRSMEHTPLEGEPRDIQTNPGIRSVDSEIAVTDFQDSVRRG